METTDTCGWEKKNQRVMVGGPINILIINENEKLFQNKKLLCTQNTHRNCEMRKFGNFLFTILWGSGVLYIKRIQQRRQLNDVNLLDRIRPKSMLEFSSTFPSGRYGAIAIQCLMTRKLFGSRSFLEK